MDAFTIIKGCNGAWTYSYLKTSADTGLGLTHESTYPYLNTAPTLTCPTTEPYNTGAKERFHFIRLGAFLV